MSRKTALRLAKKLARSLLAEDSRSLPASRRARAIGVGEASRVRRERDLELRPLLRGSRMYTMGCLLEQNANGQLRSNILD